MEIFKAASSDNDFESSFFTLAYDKLQNKLANLLQYLIGFEVIHKNDTYTKACGVFGFRGQNGQVLLVPCFFINGKIKDLDILYSKNNNQMYPLNEDFAALFLQEDQSGLGNVSNDKRQKLEGNVNPVDYRDLMIPPRTGRTAYASFTDYLEEADNNTKQAALELLEKNAEFMESALRFYSIEELGKSLIMKKEALNEVQSKVELVDRNSKTIPEEAKKTVATKGYAILDRRTEGEKNKFGKFVYTEQFNNPIESGFYSYITKVGTLRHGLVLIKPFNLLNGFPNNKTLVVDLEGKNLKTYVVDDKPVFIREQLKVSDFSSVHKLMEDPAEVKPAYDSKYILINENLKASIPFSVKQNFKDNNGIRRLVVDVGGCCESICCGASPTKDMDNAMKTSHTPNFNSFIRDPKSYTTTLVFTKRVGEKIEFRGENVYVPKGFKLFSVDTSTYINAKIDWAKDTEETRKKKEDDILKEEQRLKQGAPGTIYNLCSLLSSKAVLPMSVRSNGSDYFVSINDAKKQYPNPMKAKIGMVLDFGLDEQAGNSLIDSLIPNVTVTGTIKLAYTGDYYHQISEEAPGANELGQPMYYGLPYMQTAPPDQAPPQDASRLGLGTKSESGSQGMDVNSKDVQQAVQMAQGGQKQIFDAQAISTLAKYNDPSGKVISYIPNFVDSLDKLGRMLFMVYWDIDKFQKMYGYDELPEFIDLIKNVFNNLGDLVIFLKRKFPDLSINNNDQGMTQV